MPLKDEDYLILSTIHSEKGQEWKSVYLLDAVDGCIHGIFPGSDLFDNHPEVAWTFINSMLFGHILMCVFGLYVAIASKCSTAARFAGFRGNRATPLSMMVRYLCAAVL